MGRGITWNTQLTTILGGEDEAPGRGELQESLHSLQMSNSLFAEVGNDNEDMGGLLGGMGSLINSGALEGLEDGLLFEQSDHSRLLASSNHSQISRDSQISKDSSTSSFAADQPPSSFVERARAIAAQAPPMSPRRKPQALKAATKTSFPGNPAKSSSLYSRFNDSDLTDFENSFFEETEVDYNIEEDDISQSDNQPENNIDDTRGRKHGDEDESDGDDSYSSSSSGSSSSSSSSSSEDEATKQFRRDKLDGVLRSPMRTTANVQINSLSSSKLFLMDSIVENFNEDLSLTSGDLSETRPVDEDKLIGDSESDEDDELEFHFEPETELPGQDRIDSQRESIDNQGEDDEEEASTGNVADGNELLRLIDTDEGTESTREDERKMAPLGMSVVDVEDSVQSQRNNPDTVASARNDTVRGGGDSIPWIGFPPWGTASVVTGKLELRQTHGAYGYRGVYGVQRTTTPTKTFESIQRIQRFSQQQT